METYPEALEFVSWSNFFVWVAIGKERTVLSNKAKFADISRNPQIRTNIFSRGVC